MEPQDFQGYGPIQRRGKPTRPRRDMATPQETPSYAGATLPIRTTTRRPPPRRGSSRWWLGPLIALIVVLAGLLGGLTYLDQRYAGRIYPGVSIQGVDLTEMTAAGAERAVHERFDRFLQAPLRFRYLDRTWEPTPDEIGLQVNIDAQVIEALRTGRGNGLLRDIQQIGIIWQQGLDLPLRITVDARKLQAYLLEIATPLEQPATEAALMIDPAAGTASSTESDDGRMLLVDDTLAEALASLETLEPQVVPIRTQTLEPDLATSDIAEAKRTVDAMLQGPLELLFKDQTFPLTRTDIADMIVVTRLPGENGPMLNAQLDQKKLTRWVTRLADKIGRESIEPRVSWNGGSLLIREEGRSAYRLEIERAVERINELIMASERRVELPVEEVQPQVTAATLPTLGIKELVASGKSDFSGSAAYRVTNIKAGVRLMDGILIPPDGEFSFNENVGEIDEAHGFVEGYAIVGNRTQLEPGGGICQVSTTLFRAAFYAGLPFEEWNPHRFRISWYEKYDPIGMDAAIFTGGGPDLRFVNDTGNWILIEGIVDEASASVTFNLYGTKVSGRTVERTEPEITNQTPPPAEPVFIDDPEQPLGTVTQSDTARGGLDIQIVRIVKQDGVEVRRTPFITKFAPWPNVFIKNPNAPLPPGAKLGNG